MENNQNEEKYITLGQIFQMFARRIWWLVGIFVCGCIVTLILTLLMVKPKYKSTTSILVNQEKFTTSGSSDVSGALRATQTISEWIVDTSIVEEAISTLSTDSKVGSLAKEYTASSFKKCVSTTVSTSSLFVYVTFTSGNEEFSQTALKVLIQTGIDKTNEKVGETYKYPVVENSYNVVTEATPSEKTGTSKSLYMVIGALVSLVVGCAVCIIIELCKNKYTTPDEAQDGLKRPILGFQSDDKVNLNSGDINSDSFVNKTNYEKLLTNIDFSIEGESKKVIEITSTSQEEGKSTTVMNLGKTLSNNNRKCLIIDLDLRKPRLHQYFGVERANGISEYVTSDIENVNIHQIDSNLSVITAGAKVPNPTVILQSEKLAELINKFRNEYDYIILDTAPVMATSDAKVVTKISDAVIYVLAANQTKASLAKKCIAELDNEDANILGLNITKVKRAKKDDYYYYYSEK